MGERPGVLIYFEVLDSIEELDLESRGILFSAILKYGRDGTLPDFEANVALKVLWPLIRSRIDASSESYEQSRLKSVWGVYKREATKRGDEVIPFDRWVIMGHDGGLSNNNNNQTEPNNNETITRAKHNEESPRSHFVTPSLDEVADYCSERNNGVDPQRFLDYYTSNGWMVGKNRMKDWKAAVRTWETNGVGKEGVSLGTTFNSSGRDVGKLPSVSDGWDFSG